MLPFHWMKKRKNLAAQSHTDVDLFASYGLTQKAIGLLEAILRRAPGIRLPMKLLDFVLGAGRPAHRGSWLLALKEKLHSERGDQRGAERFAELRRRFQRAAGLSDAELEAASEAALLLNVRALRPIPVMISLILKNLPLSNRAGTCGCGRACCPVCFGVQVTPSVGIGTSQSFAANLQDVHSESRLIRGMVVSAQGSFTRTAQHAPVCHARARC